MIIEIPVSIGELIDKLTILHIKKEKIKDKEKLSNICKEYDLLNKKMKMLSIDLNEEYLQLYRVNLTLWDIEDKIRIKEKHKQFDNEFIILARSVYYTNDERSKIKKNVNQRTGSFIVEEKKYNEYN